MHQNSPFWSQQSKIFLRREHTPHPTPLSTFGARPPNLWHKSPPLGQIKPQLLTWDVSLHFSVKYINDYVRDKSLICYKHLSICQVLSYDEWREKSILEEQPMRTLTKPYFRFVQRCYCVLGLLQLTYMIYFSRYYMPRTSSLIQLFNISTCVTYYTAYTYSTQWFTWTCHIKTVLFRRCFGSSYSF